MSEYCLYCCEEKGRPGGCKVCGPGAPGKEVERHPLFLKAGTLLNGQYLVGRVLGHGGFGVTYLGVDVRLGLRVAIKEHLPRELAARDTDGVSVSIFSGDAADAFRYGLSKFLEEGRSLARLRGHPNIVGVLSFFEENSTGYLVMDFVEGMSLDELCRRKGGRLREEEAVPIMMAVLDGLRAVHKAGMLHRDIKPQNIYYGIETGQVKLLDFGAAREAFAGQSKSLTQLWTPGFAPVEQCYAGGKQGPWTDIYAVGATLYSLLTGAFPTEPVARMAGERLSSPREMPGDGVGERVSRAVMRALELRSEDRYQNVEEMQRDLMVRAEGNKDRGVGIGGGISGSRSGTGFSGGALAQGGSRVSENLARPAKSFIDEGVNKKPEKSWHLSVGGRPSKGISLTELRKEIAEGRVRRETMVWNEDLWGGTPAGRVKELAGEFPREVQTVPASGKREILETDDDLIVPKAFKWKPAAFVVGSIIWSIILVLVIVLVGRDSEQAALEQAGRWEVSGYTVRDTRTGRIWQRNAPSQTNNWGNGKRYCENLSLGGHNDWRLPKIQELRSLIEGCPGREEGGACRVSDPGCLEWSCRSGGACDSCDIRKGPGDGGCYWSGVWQGRCGWFWSSSTRVGSPGDAWGVNFNTGYVYSLIKSNNGYVRCVRGGS